MKNLDEQGSGSPSKSDWGCLLLMLLPLVWLLYRGAPEAFSLKGFSVLVIMIAAARGLIWLADRWELPESVRVICTVFFAYVAIVSVFRSAEISTLKQWGDQLAFQGGASGGLPHLLGALVAIFLSLKLIADNRGGLRNLFHIAGPERVERYQAAGADPGSLRRGGGRGEFCDESQNPDEASTE